MLMRVRLTAFDILLYAVVVLAWGFAWIGIHFQIGVVSPDVSIVWRFLIAGVVMLALAWWRRDGCTLRCRSISVSPCSGRCCSA